jgi:hypothetical protein
LIPVSQPIGRRTSNLNRDLFKNSESKGFSLVFEEWIGYKSNDLEVYSMKKERFSVLALILVFLGATHFIPFPAYAQKSTKALTLLYSNNINGEIDSCPT